ncbi:cyclase family protein [Nocardioides endophyticus]|uniref:Cyclase family protein n=1 Tax=Nocardioides endophyticus TaxID=1353775 RepID=A0ABP8Z150_9ACTN
MRHAAGLVHRGATFSLAIPMDRTGPQSGRTARVNPQHVMLRHGGDMLADGDSALHGMRSTDDAVYMPLQSSTQWDALCHIFFDGRAYNDRGPESVTSAGAHFNSITTIADRAVGRGVLLDLPRLLGVPWLEPGHAIQDTDVERCLAAQGLEVRPGDFVLVRTGHLARRREEPGWGDYVAGSAPGLGLSAAVWLAEQRVAAVASDTWGTEVLPSECAEISHPVHVLLMVNVGIRIGEIWDLDALAEDCARDGVHEFLLTCQPLTITGSVGSPVNPIAVK